MKKINLQQWLFMDYFVQIFLLFVDIRQKTAFFLSALVLQLLFTNYRVNAQYYNQTPEFLKANSHWALSRGSGVEFTTGTAVFWANSIYGMEGSATVSDPNTGDVVFYTDGGSVWNKNHQLMPNGTGLMGNNYSTLQGSLIVPFIPAPDQENQAITKYYLFSLVQQGGIRTNTQTGERGVLFYNVVDMNLENGDGDVDTNYKNIVLDTNRLGEALIAIPGCDNDIWVFTHSHDQSPQVYKAYHITHKGLDTIPVISEGKTVGNNMLSYMAVSPDRQKVAFINYSGEVELSDIDLQNGTISNSVVIPVVLSGRTVAFSPDNKKLYASGVFNIFQYDISVVDSATIVASEENIASSAFAQVRLYNDTIYVMDYSSLNAVHRINQPNNSGTACDFQANAVSLSVNNIMGALGNDVVFAIKPDSVYSLLDTIICSGWDAGVYLEASDTSYSSYTWSTGDTSSSIQINGHGTYWVSYFQCNKYHRDSFVVKGSDLYTDITVNGHQLGTTGGPFSTYQWYLNGEKILGATGPTIMVTQNGDYTVEITDEYGCIFMSNIYKVNNVNIQNLQDLARAIRIYPNPATEKINIDAPIPVKYVIIGIDGKELIKGDNQLPVNISSLAQGIYFVTLTDTEGRMLKTEKIVKKP